MEKQNLRILLVDDRPENLFALEELLANTGIQLVRALSGSEALYSVLKQEFALILMDIQMPGMDGYETVSLIKKSPRTKDIPVIFITAINTETENVHKGYACGAIDFICKPIDQTILLAKVNLFLEMALQKQQLSEAKKKLEKINHSNQMILKHAAEGIIEIDSNGLIKYVNPSAETQLKYKSKELVGHHIELLLSSTLNKPEKWLASSLNQSMKDMQSGQNIESKVFRSDGSTCPIEYSFGPFYVNEQAGGVFIFKDITEKIKAKEALVKLATHDVLTGLPNRAFLLEKLNSSLGQAKRLSVSAVFFFIDLDDFKQVNDEMGHEAGDELLKQVAKRLKFTLRESDTLARIGGDEFAIVLGVDSREADAEKVAEKLVTLLSTVFNIQGKQVNIGCSIGIAKYPTDAKNPDDLIKAADTAMYQIKKSGKKGYKLYTSKFHSIIKSRTQLERDLKVCIDQSQLQTYYQPLISAQTGKIASAEALARWFHPKRGWVSPEDFIPVAEDIGMIDAIDQSTLTNVCRQINEWKQKKIWSDNIYIAVNFSAKQILRKQLTQLVESILLKSQIKTESIEIEVTESMLMSKPEYCINALSKLKEMGIKIAIDDFGTGFSSLSYLRQLPAQKLKIDRSFIKEINIDKHGEMIVIATIDLAHNLGLKVVAEGVENEMQRDFLIHHGCDYLQGFLFSKPLSAKDFKLFLK